METGNTNSGRERFRGNRSGRVLAGLILVIIGGLFLSREYITDIPYWVFSWPMILIGAGVFFGARRSFQAGGWMVMVLVGLIFLLGDMFPGQPLWPIAIIVVGLWMIFKPRRHRREWKWDEGISGENTININSVFGGSKKKIMSKDFKGGEINTVFGGNDLDFTQADFNGTATIEINVVFGGVKLLVPSHWKIQSEIDCVFGSVEDKRKDTNEVSDKTLVLKGSVVFGGIEIKSY